MFGLNVVGDSSMMDSKVSLGPVFDSSLQREQRTVQIETSLVKVMTK